MPDISMATETARTVTLNPFPFVSILFLAVVLFFVADRIHYKAKKIITPYRILFFGVAFSAFLFVLPIYRAKGMTEGVGGGLYAVAVSLQHIFRMFVMDGSIGEVTELLASYRVVMAAGSYHGYMLWGSVLYALAPILTFGFLLSFFKNLSSYLHYYRHFGREVHCFSELNEKSLALAKSIGKPHAKGFFKAKKVRLVFADIVDRNEETLLALIEEAEELGAILFRKDIVDLWLAPRHPGRVSAWRYEKRLRTIKKNEAPHKAGRYHFYLTEEDETEKLRHISGLMKRYRDRADVCLYVFSDSVACNSFLTSYNEENGKDGAFALKIIHVDPIRSLIYYDLGKSGLSLFQKANALRAREVREISAVIVGLGKYGMEMLKALLWYCQLPGYRIKITAFDEDAGTIDRFRAMCPEIPVNLPLDLPDAEGDMRCTVNIKTGRADDESFRGELYKLSDVGFLFVALGNDSQNIAASLRIRTWMEQWGRAPMMKTVVYDSELAGRLGADPCASSEKTTRREKQNIQIIGDLDSFYSYETVIDSKLIGKGLDVHIRWGDTATSFYMNDYNYFSSLASALHRELRGVITEHKALFPFVEECEPGRYRALYHMDRERVLEMLGKINDNEALNALSSEMQTTRNVLYARLGYLHYGRLKETEKERVLARLRCRMEAIKKKKQDAGKNYQYKLRIFGSDAERFEEFLKEPTRWEPGEVDASYELYLSIGDILYEDRAKRESTRRDILLSLEFDSLPEADKQKLRGCFQKDIDLFIEDARCFALIEHIRWNAYMRAEGYRYTDGEEKKLFLLHPDLVPVDKLTVWDCVKDI